MSWHDDRGDRVVERALTIASERGRVCRPIDVLAALAEVDGPIGATLREADGGPMFPDTAGTPGLRGGSNGHLATQAIAAGEELARQRGERCGPAHLLVAVIDQADPEVTAAFGAADQISDARLEALRVLGAAAETPALRMPPLTPAGTWDRAALEIADLNPGAWAALCWRQQRLPLSHLKRRWQWAALDSLEQRAAWRVASAFGVDDDQRYSLLRHHMDHVEAIAHAAHSDLVGTRQQRRDRQQSGPSVNIVSRGRRRHRVVPNFMVGWPCWFKNRWHGMQVKYFRLLTFPTYRGEPGPAR